MFVKVNEIASRTEQGNRADFASRKSLQLSQKVRGNSPMKIFIVTLGKIALLGVVFWILLHYAPFVAAPLMGALVAGAAVILAAAITLTLGLGLGLAVVAAVITLMGSIAIVLAPVWLPVLAIIGLVALCRPNRTVV